MISDPTRLESEPPKLGVAKLVRPEKEENVEARASNPRGVRWVGFSHVELRLQQHPEFPRPRELRTVEVLEAASSEAEPLNKAASRKPCDSSLDAGQETLNV